MALTKVIGDGTGTIDNLTVADAGTIGSASKTNAITIASSGLVQLTSTGIGAGSQVFQVIDDGATLFQIRSEDGNVSFPQSGAGIYLGVTSGNSANLLDDYEEGTWTPTIGNFTVNSGTWGATGRYVKVGNVVTVTMFQTGGNVTWSAAKLLGGLPFAPTASLYGAGTWTNGGPNAGGQVFLYHNSSFYFANAGSSQTELVMTATYVIT